MPRYKRTRDEAELDLPVEAPVDPEHAETLGKLRNMWEFASLMQYIFMFGQVVKIDDDFDIEDLEQECLSPQPSTKLAQIGLALLKYVSSHRGLTHEIFDEYTRRQYVAKAPLRNPFGNNYAEDPAKFSEFDVFTKIRVLQQLSVWTFGNAERLRGLMPQDDDHLNWRMEPLGWDQDDRSYFVLDDNRLYRRSDEPVPEPPAPKPKAKSKSSKKAKSRGTRSSKRRKVEETSDEEQETMEVDAEAGALDDTVMTNGEDLPSDEPGYGFTSKTWECVAITLEEYQEFLASIFRTRDPNEKQLRKRVEEDVLPIIEKRAEALRQKQLKKLRELENLQKMATAKRSSRLAGKAEKEKEEREQQEAEEKKLSDLKMAHEEEDRQRRIEEGHESRRLTREQRLKEREVKRILNEEKLQELQEQEARASSQDANSDATESAKRVSERQVKSQKAQTKKELEKIKEEEGAWYFDCAKCGQHGENWDDGEHSLACDQCGVWQHSKCHGLSPKQAEKEGFTFICHSCKKKEADAKKPKIPPLKLGKNRTSASPEVPKSGSRPTTSSIPQDSGLPPHVQRQLDGMNAPINQPRVSPGPFGQITGQINNGPSLSPHGQAQGPPGYRYPPVGNFAPQAPQQAWHGTPIPPPARPPSSGYSSSPPAPITNGYDQPPHHQQHQYAHQSAVTGSGGHPHYRPPPPPQYMPQANGHSPRAPANLAHQMYAQPPPQYNQYNQPQQRRGSSHLMNGFQSPVKAAATAQPPYQQSPNQAPPTQQPHPSPSLQQSPKPALPPPTTIPYPPTGHSPVKSSPAAHHHQRPPPPQPQLHHPSPTLTQTTPQTFRPPSSNGYQPNFQTPQMRPGSAHANGGSSGIAADGMSGPWPEGSQAIPRKHDQSPAAPAPPASVGSVRGLPSMGSGAVLAPSPSQVPAGVGNIPVKKSLEISANGEGSAVSGSDGKADGNEE